jgi:rubrerythrin
MKLMAMLDEAIKLEEKIYACYEALKRLSQNGLADELKALAREEKSHISVLKTGKNFIFRAPEAFGAELVTDIEVRAGLKAAIGLQAELEERKLDLTEGLKRLSELEKRFEKVHGTTAVEIDDFSLRKLFEALARADAEHRQRLGRLIDHL